MTLVEMKTKYKRNNIKIQFKVSDKNILPERYLSNEEAVNTSEYEAFAIVPKSTNCGKSNVLITIKSAVTHFGKPSLKFFIKYDFRYKIIALEISKTKLYAIFSEIKF